LLCLVLEGESCLLCSVSPLFLLTNTHT
jgi:hypothetical protein